MTLKYFDVNREFKCPCQSPSCNAPILPHRLLGLYLDRAREMLGLPIVVTSGNRCRTHNTLIGGTEPSEHVWPEGCLGADLDAPDGRSAWQLHDALRQAGFTRIGWYKKHLHAGVGDIVAPAQFPTTVLWMEEKN